MQSSKYPEHDNLQVIMEISQAQGELLEWLSSQGVQRMKFEEWDETTQRVCDFCTHYTELTKERCTCKVCKGKHEYEITHHHEDWVRDRRNINEVLAEFHGINLDKLEAEKREMLKSINELASAQEGKT